MKKIYKVKNLDCANCAAKMETAIKKISGVNDATVNFMGQRITVDAEAAAFDELVRKIEATCKKIEPDFAIAK